MNEDYAEREQSLLKHFVLGKYLSAASRIKALLIEEEQEAYERLDAYASEAKDSCLEVVARNWDFREHTAEIVQFVSSPPSFSFIFVDPTGWTPAEIAGLGPLLRLKPGEVLINFMSSFIVRFLNDEKTNMEEVLGPDYRDIRDLDHEEQEDEAVRRYCELVRRQGDFQYVCALPVMKRDQDAIHFYLIYGTRNGKGVHVFKEVEKRTEEQTAVIRADLHRVSAIIWICSRRMCSIDERSGTKGSPEGARAIPKRLLTP
jgi:three-Cys-motif partner protein